MLRSLHGSKSCDEAKLLCPGTRMGRERCCGNVLFITQLLADALAVAQVRTDCSVRILMSTLALRSSSASGRHARTDEGGEEQIRKPDAVKRQRLIEPTSYALHPCENLLSFGWFTLISCCSWCIPDQHSLRSSSRRNAQSIFDLDAGGTGTGSTSHNDVLRPFAGDTDHEKLNKLRELYKLPNALMYPGTLQQVSFR
jgi:hypothetical protein